MEALIPSKLESLCEKIKAHYTPQKGEILFFDLLADTEPQSLKSESELSQIIESMVATNAPYAVMNFTGTAPLLTLHAVNFIKLENIETGKTLGVVNDGMPTEDILALRRELKRIKNILPYRAA